MKRIIMFAVALAVSGGYHLWKGDLSWVSFLLGVLFYMLVTAVGDEFEKPTATDQKQEIKALTEQLDAFREEGERQEKKARDRAWHEYHMEMQFGKNWREYLTRLDALTTDQTVS
jgi:hypothetical protein